MTDVDQELDARNLNCPLPILRAKKILNGMQSGQIVKVLVTDSLAVEDFEVFSKQTGHEFLYFEEVGDEFHLLIRKA